MKHNNELLAMIGNEVAGVVSQQDTESVRYWTVYRAEIMQQLLDGKIEVPQGSTADQVVDAHVAKVRKMCELYGTGLPISRKIISSGGPDGFQSHTVQQKVLH